MIYRLLIFTAALAVGYTAYLFLPQNTDLQSVSADISGFDGKTVIITTYLNYDGDTFYIGQPFENLELPGYIDEIELPQSVSDSLSAPDLKDAYSRVPVQIMGTVENDCGRKTPCCFGQHFKLSKVKILGVYGEMKLISRPKK